MIDKFLEAYQSYGAYLWREITFKGDEPWWHNYFWMLIIVSLFFFILEISRPWRKGQAIFRKDFWLDFFYMFFNFFLFSLIIYNASSTVVVDLFNDGIKSISGFDLQANNPMRFWPIWAVFLTGFLVRDFVQWWTHRLLHYSPRLWQFHKVHHSVEEMGFAAHLRYHWMENVVYRSIEYIPLALLGIGLYDFFLIHIFTLAWGHYNHANFTVNKRITGAVVALAASLFIIGTETTWFQTGNIQNILAVGLSAIIAGAFILGPVMKYIFNSPEMHIWHHARDLPEDRKYGMNFGLTLAIWDYIFGTNHIPHSGRDIKLGFSGLSKFPASFFQQIKYGFGKLEDE